MTDKEYFGLCGDPTCSKYGKTLNRRGKCSGINLIPGEPSKVEIVQRFLNDISDRINRIEGVLGGME